MAKTAFSRQSSVTSKSAECQQGSTWRLGTGDWGLLTATKG